jgi:dGTPase
MDWEKLLSTQRLGKDKPDKISLERSPFQQDFDRISFSSAFRRLQDKTQVFPLAESDYVRTRLTHSMEVACIGRSLGTGVGAYICKNNDINPIQPSDIGAIVAAASLAHDIGNPPMGHSGEEAIRYWFCNSDIGKKMKKKMTKKEQADIIHYEGNAQGFRLLSKLEMPDNIGGMQLTCATLATFAKYPIEAININKKLGISAKKFNFFQDDLDLFTQVAKNTGLKELSGKKNAWCRHPLVFLVEAADDISYNIVDFEDGHKLGIISYKETEELFFKLIKKEKDTKKSLEKIKDPMRKVEFLRAKVIGKLIGEVIEVFIKNHDAIMNGKLNKPLVDLIPSTEALKVIQQRSIDDIYTYQRAVEIEAAGFELTEGLLNIFADAVNDYAKTKLKKKEASYRSKKMIQLIPEKYCKKDNQEWLKSPYIRLLNLLDFISGMTDSYAVALYKKIKGISLPSGNM